MGHGYIDTAPALYRVTSTILLFHNTFLFIYVLYFYVKTRFHIDGNIFLCTRYQNYILYCNIIGINNPIIYITRAAPIGRIILYTALCVLDLLSVCPELLSLWVL